MSNKTGEILGVLTFGILLFSVEGLGPLLTVAIVALLAGHAIGGNDILLTIYVIGAMSFSYVIPLLLVLTFRLKNIGQAFLVLIVACLIFAVPSSFIAESGCRVGNEKAMWALKAVPILWLGDTLTPRSEGLTCDAWVRKL
jgi:hypothetical protein